MKRIFLFGVMALLMASCNKNQKAVKKLDGIWNATSFVETYDGVSEDLFLTGSFGLSMEFEGCKLKNNDFCSSTWKYSYGNAIESELYDFRVAGDGTRLEIKDPQSTTNIALVTIDELTNKELKLTIDDGDGDFFTIELEKE